MIDRLKALLRGEPVLTAAAVDVIVGLGLLLGTDLDPAEVGVVSTGVAALTKLGARHWTTPASGPTEPAERRAATTLKRL